MLYTFFMKKNGNCKVIFLCFMLLFLSMVSLEAAEAKKQTIDFDYKAETAKSSNAWNGTVLNTKQTKAEGSSSNRSAAAESAKKTGSGTNSSDGVFVAFGDSSNASNGDDGGYLKANDNVYAQNSSVVESVPSVGLSIKIGSDTKQKRTASGNSTVGQPVQKSTAVQKKATVQKTTDVRKYGQPKQSQQKNAITVSTVGVPKNSTKKRLSGETEGASSGWKRRIDAEKADEKRKKEQARKSVNVAEIEVEKIMAENKKQKTDPDSTSVANVATLQKSSNPPQESAMKTEAGIRTVPAKAGKIIQFGAYSQKSGADAAVGKAAKAGVKNSKIVPLQQNGKTVYRVQVTTSGTGNDTQYIAERLKKAGFSIYIK